MIMRLSKVVPSRRKTIKFNWAWKNFTVCSERYLEIRGKYKRRGRATMVSCDWCGHEFEIGEMIGLAQPRVGQEGPKRNWALCQTCAETAGAKELPNRTKEG